jgi:hypothetical protein
MVGELPRRKTPPQYKMQKHGCEIDHLILNRRLQKLSAVISGARMG